LTLSLLYSYNRVNVRTLTKNIMKLPITISALAELGNINIKTLYYYDKIWLLKPSLRKNNNYRVYGKKEILLLQQILFYKELGFCLLDIKDIISSEEFNVITSLKKQKSLLQKEKKDIGERIYTIDDTILNYNKDNMIDYAWLYKRVWKKYRKQAIEKYGAEIIGHSENSVWMLWSNKIQELIDIQNKNWIALFNARERDHTSKEVQTLIAEHYNIIKTFWWKTPTDDEYLWLAQMYIDDITFVTIENLEYPEFATFLQSAMKYFIQAV